MGSSSPSSSSSLPKGFRLRFPDSGQQWALGQWRMCENTDPKCLVAELVGLIRPLGFLPQACSLILELDFRDPLFEKPTKWSSWLRLSQNLLSQMLLNGGVSSLLMRKSEERGRKWEQRTGFLKGQHVLPTIPFDFSY